MPKHNEHGSNQGQGEKNKRKKAEAVEDHGSTAGPSAPKSAKPKIVYLIRHGESEANARLPHSGIRRFDSPLSPAGRDQAVDLRTELAKWGGTIDLLVVSPLSRALETAAIAFPFITELPRDRWPFPVIVEPLCRERIIHHGDIGRSSADLVRDFPWYDLTDLSPNWWTHGGDTATGGGMTVVDGAEKCINEPNALFVKRVNSFRRWLQARPETNIAVVGHSVLFSGLNQGAQKMFNCEMVKMKLYP